METDENGNSQDTPLPYRGEGAEFDLDLFSSESFEGYEQIDLGGLFDQRSPDDRSTPQHQSPPQAQGEAYVGAAAASTRTRRYKPPKPPKRPLSAYNLFFKSIRPNLVQEMGGDTRFDQLGRIVGERWRNLTNEEKAVYEAMADEDVIRYRNEMAAHDRERRRRQAEIRAEQERQQNRERRPNRPPIILRITKFPPPPPGQYMGPAPSYLRLEDEDRTVTLVDTLGREKLFTIKYGCYSVRRSDLDTYLASITELTRHYTAPDSDHPG